MTAVSRQSVFPFVIEEVSPARVQFWSEYAAGALTRSQMYVVSFVFSALWREFDIAHSYQLAVSCMGEQGGFARALGWLDCAVVSAVSLSASSASSWGFIVASLEQLLGEDAAQDLGYQDAVQHLQSFRALAVQVAQYVAAFCEDYQLVVPKYTRTFLGIQ